MNPEMKWRVAALSRASDGDRPPRFFRAVKRLGCAGFMGDLDDGPEQAPLAEGAVERAVLSLTERRRYALVVTHSVQGEYTRHRRHEETGRALVCLWESGRIHAARLWMFAYEDGGGAFSPKPITGAHHRLHLPHDVHEQKKSIISDIYGFSAESFEARAAGAVEAFWTFDSAEAARAFMETDQRR